MASQSLNQSMLARFKAQTSPQTQSPLLERLPIEIRLQVYKLILDQITVQDERRQSGAWRIEGPQILAVCKKGFCEALEYATRVSYILDWRRQNTNTIPAFFDAFPMKLRHRLEKITLQAGRFPLRKWDSELSVSGFSALRVIELVNGENQATAIEDRDKPAFFDQVANLIRCLDGPNAFESEDNFATQALATYCSPTFVHYLQTSNVLVRTKIDLRFKVWERFKPETPFQVGWKAISVFEYWDLTIEWQRDSVKLVDCPDLRDRRWYPRWTEVPKYYREFEFLSGVEELPEDVPYVVCIDHALPCSWGDDWGLMEFIPGSWH
ncbi:hypothetical protein LTR84_005457 [Exophiala bonariae]|uniref:Uncharacterized protein n=1 Tax=Exophiala bonariae TaxID=1690606 RepID=A0AAV9N3S0_9EURO|nr:hypothetical protein LTR84_005457 [Exophiala bonariae]